MSGGIRALELQDSGCNSDTSSATSDEGEMWEETVEHWASILCLCRGANKERGQVESSCPEEGAMDWRF